MIYPDVSIEEWMKKYPDLSLLSRECEGCGKEIKADKPFLMKGYAGLIAPNCECGRNKGSCSSRITINKEEHNRWISLTSGM